MQANRKALVIAAVASTIEQFNRDNIRLLQELNYTVDVAADFSNPGNITKEKAAAFRRELADGGVNVYDTSIPRGLNPVRLLHAYRAVKRLVTGNGYDLIHCHTPVAAAVVRTAARKERAKGTKIIYTAHGFHFYKGAPLKNWLVYYPAERFFSRCTDVLITINKEDFKRARKHFAAKQIRYVPGVGVDTAYFAPGRDKTGLRAELGIPEDAPLYLSVGELNRNKNHETILRALTIPDMPPVYYVIVGQGALRKKLENLAASFGLSARVKLAGYRGDIIRFYRAADAFVFPSFREGLPVSLMEAMSCGLPVICSAIRGNTDLVDETGGYLFDPRSAEQAGAAIRELEEGGQAEGFGAYNRETILRYDKHRISEIMKQLYADI